MICCSERHPLDVSISWSSVKQSKSPQRSCTSSQYFWLVVPSYASLLSVINDGRDICHLYAANNRISATTATSDEQSKRRQMSNRTNNKDSGVTGCVMWRS